MKPAWDQLMGEFAESKSAVIADVDCTAGGKGLCEKVGIKGYPSIKYGDPNNLEDYQGGRDFDALKAFADENLGPSCSPDNLDLCDDEKKTQIEGFLAMSSDDVDAEVKKMEGEIESAEKNFKTKLEALQKNYENLSKKKDDDIKAVKASGLGLMKACMAAKKKDR